MWLAAGRRNNKYKISDLYKLVQEDQRVECDSTGLMYAKSDKDKIKWGLEAVSEGNC